MLPGPTTASYLCCGVRIDALQPDDALEIILASRRGTSRSVHLCNAYTLSLATRDPRLKDMLNSGDVNLADGAPVAWIGQRLGHANMRTRVYGPTLFARALDEGRARRLRHFLYGSSPGVVTSLVGAIETRWPGAQVVGAEPAPFRPITTRERGELCHRVAEAAADVVWVGLGTPKQDVFAEQMKADLAATVVAVGAAFDFVAGTKHQAPLWLQNHGLEWGFRLATEPRRLWRRYLIGNALFLRAAIRDLRTA